MPQSVEVTRCKNCKWCRKISPTRVNSVTVDATCDSHWGASSLIQSEQTTYQNIVTLGTHEDILGYKPEGNPKWASLLKDESKTCFQEKNDQRPGELLQRTS